MKDTMTTITLRLDGDAISARAFVTKVNRFLALLREVDRTVTAESAETAADVRPEGSVTWVIESIRSGSPVTMTLRAAPASDTSAALAVAERLPRLITGGLGQMTTQRAVETPPPFFTLPALNEVHQLARPSLDGLRGVSVSTSLEDEVTLTDWTELNAQQFIRARYEEYGSIEGMLQMVSVAGGAHFTVRDTITGRAVECRVPPEQLDTVIRAFRKRVAVYGYIETNERGGILRIRMDDLELLADDNDLPTVEQVAGTFDITEGIAVREFIAGLHDAP